MGLASFKHHDDSRRSAARRPVDGDSTLRTSASTPLDAVVSDLSETGFSVAVDADLPIDAPLSIGLPGIGRRAATVVRRTEEGYGCRFDEPIPPHAVTTAFTAPTVVYVGTPSTDDLWASAAEAVDPPTDRWPGAVRIGILAVGGIAPWLVLLAILH